jgi:hypothetical protein
MGTSAIAAAAMAELMKGFYLFWHFLFDCAFIGISIWGIVTLNNTPNNLPIDIRYLRYSVAAVCVFGILDMISNWIRLFTFFATESSMKRMKDMYLIFIVLITIMFAWGVDEHRHLTDADKHTMHTTYEPAWQLFSFFLYGSLVLFICTVLFIILFLRDIISEGKSEMLTCFVTEWTCCSCSGHESQPVSVYEKYYHIQVPLTFAMLGLMIWAIVVTSAYNISSPIWSYLVAFYVLGIIFVLIHFCSNVYRCCCEAENNDAFGWESIVRMKDIYMFAMSIVVMMTIVGLSISGNLADAEKTVLQTTAYPLWICYNFISWGMLVVAIAKIVLLGIAAGMHWNGYDAAKFLKFIFLKWTFADCSGLKMETAEATTETTV